MTVALAWTAGHVVATPIAYLAAEREEAVRAAGLRWTTWRAAIDACVAARWVVFNRDAAEHAASVQQPSLPLSGVA